MKRLISLALVTVLCLGLFGCTAYDDKSVLDSIKQLQAEQERLEKEQERLEKEQERLEKELVEAKARLLLLEGYVAGDPNKVYGLGDTVTFVSQGLAVFSITIDEAWIYLSNIYFHFTYKNFNLPSGFTLDQIFDAQTATGGENSNRYNSNEHRINIGETYSSKNDPSSATNGKPTLINANLGNQPGIRRIIFGTYNYKYNENDRQVFVPFAAFDIDFQPKT